MGDKELSWEGIGGGLKKIGKLFSKMKKAAPAAEEEGADQ